MTRTAPDLPERFNAATFFVDRHLRQGRGARTAFRFRGRAVTYAEVAERADGVAAGLAGLGVEIENRVVLVLRDSPAFAAGFWGAVKLGAVAVPLNTLMGDAEYEFILSDSRAKVAIVEPDFAPRFAALRARCRWLRAVVVAESTGAGSASSAPPEGGLIRMPGAADGPVAAADTLREDVMYWGYTSGSTGKPKAAVHTHRDFVAAAEHVGTGIFGIGPEDLTFSASKMFFAFGLGNSLYFPAAVGAASVLVPERIEPELAFETIARERPTIFFTVPTLYARMLEVPDAERRFDLGSLRFCVSSGEALPPAIFDAWQERFKLELVDVLGSTEALHDFIANRPGQARRGSAGAIIPGFEARLVDDDGAAVPDGTVGHLLIKGPTTMAHYWNRLDRTRATMLGEWIRTGDVLSRDADGYFYFHGRSDDMLRVGGLWVSPAEIEARLLEHPAVLEAGVVGRREADGLVRPSAAVVLKAGRVASDALAAELREFVRSGLAGFKVPRGIEFVAELPKTATGKLQRFRLRAPPSEETG
jgi:benzoate-CoA ligase